MIVLIVYHVCMTRCINNTNNDNITYTNSNGNDNDDNN